MSFSAQTCLTNTGTTTLGSTIVFYSDIDGYFTSFGSTSTTNIVGGNCPFTITGIPDGTTSIRLYDPTSNCCVNIPIQSNDFCVTCDLDFTVLSSTTVSQIVAGNLTGSCDNITDYVVYWYGPNSSTNIGYISGKGSAFSYQFTHPLTGTSAIFAQAGTYTPIIDKVKISGLTFSQTGGSGNYLANLECFSPITVNPLTCDNGTSVGDYNHVVQFSGASLGIPPIPLEATFQLSSTTNYFAFSFQGFTVSDRLTLEFSGVNYSDKITLEDIVLGSNTSTNFLSFPRSGGTSGVFYRVLTLTGLTRGTGDFISITVTPNTANTSTNWSFSCQCLETFNCSSCFDNYINSPYPIVGSSITGVTGTCSQLTVNFSVSGCSSDDIDSWDVDKYIIPTTNLSGGYNVESWAKTNNITKLLNRTSGLFYNQILCNLNTSPYNPAATCSPITANTITYEKGVSGGQGFFNITCSNYSDFLSFWDGYQYVYGLYSGNPTNNLSLDYYRFAVLRVPIPIGNNCGDSTTFRDYNFHYSSVVTSGGTGPWTMSLTMPTISLGIPFTTCNLNCVNASGNIITPINNSSTGTAVNVTGTTITGSKATVPFVTSNVLVSATTTTSANSINSFFNLLYTTTTGYPFVTLPWSGISNTYINNQSGSTCDTTYYQPAFGYNYRWLYYYDVRMLNPTTDIRDFEIYAAPIINGNASGFPGTYQVELAYQYSGGTVTYSNPTYIV